MANSDYIGRFAPTPSGPLHFGSIVAALGSYLQAKHSLGKWLVRIEDIDQPRSRPGIDKLILQQLEKLGLNWDGEVIYQNQRLDLYKNALDTLKSLDFTFPCTCSRKDIADNIYPGTCRSGVKNNQPKHAIRVRIGDEKIGFNDLLQGYFSQIMDLDVGDFVIRRSDGLFAYHLAVVVDDHEQGITEIVRGADLLDSTPRQIYLQQILKLNTPRYLHLPLATNASGNKISKQSETNPIDLDSPVNVLYDVLVFLGQSPPPEAKECDKESLIDWAIKNWRVNQLPHKKEIKVETY